MTSPAAPADSLEVSRLETVKPWSGDGLYTSQTGFSCPHRQTELTISGFESVVRGRSQARQAESTQLYSVQYTVQCCVHVQVRKGGSRLGF